MSIAAGRGYRDSFPVNLSSALKKWFFSAAVVSGVSTLYLFTLEPVEVSVFSSPQWRLLLAFDSAVLKSILRMESILIDVTAFGSIHLFSISVGLISSNALNAFCRKKRIAATWEHDSPRPTSQLQWADLMVPSWSVSTQA